MPGSAGVKQDDALASAVRAVVDSVPLSVLCIDVDEMIVLDAQVTLFLPSVGSVCLTINR